MIRWFLKNQSRFLVPVALKKTNAKKVAIVFSEQVAATGFSFQPGVEAEWKSQSEAGRRTDGKSAPVA